MDGKSDSSESLYSAGAHDVDMTGTEEHPGSTMNEDSRVNARENHVQHSRSLFPLAVGPGEVAQPVAATGSDKDIAMSGVEGHLGNGTITQSSNNVASPSNSQAVSAAESMEGIESAATIDNLGPTPILMPGNNHNHPGLTTPANGIVATRQQPASSAGPATGATSRTAPLSQRQANAHGAATTGSFTAVSLYPGSTPPSTQQAVSIFANSSVYNPTPVVDTRAAPVRVERGRGSAPVRALEEVQRIFAGFRPQPIANVGDETQMVRLRRGGVPLRSLADVHRIFGGWNNSQQIANMRGAVAVIDGRDRTPLQPIQDVDQVSGESFGRFGTAPGHTGRWVSERDLEAIVRRHIDGNGDADNGAQGSSNTAGPMRANSSGSQPFRVVRPDNDGAPSAPMPASGTASSRGASQPSQALVLGNAGPAAQPGAIATTSGSGAGQSTGGNGNRSGGPCRFGCIALPFRTKSKKSTAEPTAAGTSTGNGQGESSAAAGASPRTLRLNALGPSTGDGQMGPASVSGMHATGTLDGNGQSGSTAANGNGQSGSTAANGNGQSGSAAANGNGQSTATRGTVRAVVQDSMGERTSGTWESTENVDIIDMQEALAMSRMEDLTLENKPTKGDESDNKKDDAEHPDA